MRLNSVWWGLYSTVTLGPGDLIFTDGMLGGFGRYCSSDRINQSNGQAQKRVGNSGHHSLRRWKASYEADRSRSRVEPRWRFANDPTWQDRRSRSRPNPRNASPRGKSKSEKSRRRNSNPAWKCLKRWWFQHQDERRVRTDSRWWVSPHA